MPGVIGASSVLPLSWRKTSMRFAIDIKMQVIPGRAKHGVIVDCKLVFGTQYGAIGGEVDGYLAVRCKCLGTADY